MFERVTRTLCALFHSRLRDDNSFWPDDSEWHGMALRAKSLHYTRHIFHIELLLFLHFTSESAIVEFKIYILYILYLFKKFSPLTFRNSMQQTQIPSHIFNNKFMMKFNDKNNLYNFHAFNIFSRDTYVVFKFCSAFNLLPNGLRINKKKKKKRISRESGTLSQAKYTRSRGSVENSFIYRG